MLALKAANKRIAELEVRVVAVEKKTEEAELTLAALSQRPKFFIPSISVQSQMDLQVYTVLLASFQTLNFKIEPAFAVSFPAIACVNPGAIEQDFHVYRVIIRHAYDSIDSKSPEQLVEGDPAIDLYNYMKILKDLPPQYCAAGLDQDLEHRRAIFNAFEIGDMRELKKLLDRIKK
jgi:hypothetical protein